MLALLQFYVINYTMTKLTAAELLNKNCVDDADDETDDFEDSIIRDSVLKLTSNTFDNLSCDEFVGAKLKIINSASQDEIVNEYKGINISRKSLPDLDSSTKFTDDNIGSDDDYDDDDDADDGDNMKSSLKYDSDDASEFNDSESDTSFDSSKRNQSETSEQEVLQNSSTMKQFEKSKHAEELDYDIYSKFSQNNITEDIEKGNAVHQQMSIWETLLECRIKLHKALIASNKLPQIDDYSSFTSGCSQNSKKKTSKTCRDIAMLLQLILTIQKKLMCSFPDFNKTSLKSDNGEDNGNEMDSESISSSVTSGLSEQMKDETSDFGDCDQNEDDDTLEPPTKIKKLEDYSKDLANIHKDFLLVKNESIQKWNDKTRISSGRIKSSNFAAFEQSTLQQIENILSDHDRLIKRTQTKRSVYKILRKHDIDGKELKEDKELDEEIFDDDDFYHKILKAFIEQKSTDITSVQQMGKQWAELQKMRSKMKRPIDVKATKGRRLRYTTHSKLVNFGAPVPYNSWTDEAELELFSSLFGEIHKK